MTLESSHLCIQHRASLTKYSNRCIFCHTSVPLDTWQQQEGSKPCIHTTVLVLTTLRCLHLLDRRASHETHTKSTCSTQVIARASTQLCLYWLQLCASIFSIHVPHMKPIVTLLAPREWSHMPPHNCACTDFNYVLPFPQSTCLTWNPL